MNRITPEELMVGNFVRANHKNTDIYNQDICIDSKHIYDYSQGRSDFNFYGIKITDKLLSKCGLYKLNNKYHFKNSKKYVIRKIGKDWFWCYVSNTDKIYFLDKIKYIHQLQNKILINIKT